MSVDSPALRDRRLRRLGDGHPIAAICQADGIDRPEFDAWWRNEVARRTSSEVTRTPPLPSGARLLRDERGVPRVIANDDPTLFFVYGIAQAQDRLFQMDLRRRIGHGRLAELIGRDGLESDRLSRTVGTHLAAQAELDALDGETLALVTSFTAGVNAAIDQRRGAEPIEYALLGAVPQPWTPVDVTACAMSWRWQLTGRLHVIAAPEVLKRELGDAALLNVVMSALREADDVSIVPGDASRPLPPDADSVVGTTDGVGSNNWVVSGRQSRSGKPLLAGDPHMPYENASAFHEVGIHGGSFDVLGAGLVGIPALAYGRNRHLAWSITNNICSLRDLYQELPRPGHDGFVAFDGGWEPLTVRTERIGIAGETPETVVVRSSRHGPLVTDVLPAAASDTGCVSLRWLGTEPCRWIGAQLGIMRSASVSSARAATRGWLVPTFNLMLADSDGHIGYQATGELPIRAIAEPGYRPGDDPAHQWAGRIPPGEMPHCEDPERGWLASANNRPAGPEFPYPLSGTWTEGHRARRIGQRLEPAGVTLDVDAMAAIQVDVTSLRAPLVVDGLLRTFDAHRLVVSRREQLALDALRSWDGRLEADSAAAAIYEVVLWTWLEAVTAERVSPEHVAFTEPLLMGLAVALFVGDPNGWFADETRRVAVLHGALTSALDVLTSLCGTDLATWTWGAIHRLALPHPLRERGDLAALLEQPSWGLGGDSATILNHGFVPRLAAARRDASTRDWHSTGGAGYRMVADLGDPAAALHAITLEGQSAELGSAHRDDQGDAFMEGRLFRMDLDPRYAANA